MTSGFRLAASIVAAFSASFAIGFAMPPHPAAPATVASAPDKGGLVGVVEDVDGDPVPGARVRVLGDEGETVAETRAARESADGLTLGEFRIDDLPAGHYHVVAEFDGTTSHAIRIPIEAWEDTRVRLHVSDANGAGT